MSRRRLRVVAAVIERGPEILVSFRRPKGSRPSQWEFPGGKIERGETEVQALVREIREELGVECEVGPLVRRHVHPFAEVDVEIAFYRTRIVSGRPRPMAMEEIRWVHRRDLGELDFLEADRAFVAELIRGRFQATRRARAGFGRAGSTSKNPTRSPHSTDSPRSTESPRSTDSPRSTESPRSTGSTRSTGTAKPDRPAGSTGKSPIRSTGPAASIGSTGSTGSTGRTGSIVAPKTSAPVAASNRTSAHSPNSAPRPKRSDTGSKPQDRSRVFGEGRR